MAVTGAITTGFRDENGVDLGRQLVEKDYLISVYPNLLSNMKAPAAFAWGTGTSGEFGNNAVSFASSPTQVLIGSSLWKQVSGGYNHAAAIAIDGTLWAWGLGTSGQLGNGVAGHRSSPIQTISFGTNWSVVGNSGNHVSSTKTDGTLWTWGLGTSGQLGDLTLVTKSSPVQAIVYAENWGSVCGGRYGTTAIKTDGTLWVWGNNGNGQLGDNTIIHRSSPVQVIGISTNWSTVAYSIKNYHVAAIKTDGTLWIWGLNSYGGLGDNTTTSKSSPIQTVAFGSNWSKVACGSNYSVAIKTDGTLWTWGRNSFGQLGDNTIIHRSSPVQTVAFGTNWSSVSCGYYHAAAIKTDGTLWMWGQGTNSQIGDNALTNRSSPVQTIAFGTNWSSVACGSNYSVAIKTDGTLWTWGNNLSGQLGDNTTTGKSSPIQTITFGTNWSSVSCGNAGTAAIKTDGTLWTWGYNLNGELGDNTNVRKSSPVQTIGRGTTWSSISCGYSNTYSIKKDGTLWSWGSEVYGAVGDNDAITNKSSPVQPLAYGLSTSWSTTSTGNTHTSAIKKDGTLWTWGLGTSGQLGNNTATSTSLPVQEMTYSTTWSSLSAGGAFTSAIKKDGTLWSWGSGLSGQLGDGTTVNTKSSPVQAFVQTTSWTSTIASGGTHAAGIKSDGTLWTWGLGTSGQLGDNTVVTKSSPVQTVTFATNWSKVALGETHSSAIKTDGTLWCWGLNTNGQLGDNTTTHRSSPVQTTAFGTTWNAVSCGQNHTLATKTDGTLWLWGRNSYGQLGDNTITHRSSPIQTVAFGTTWSSISGAEGGGHSAATKTDGTVWTWGLGNNFQLGDGTGTTKSSPVQVLVPAKNWTAVISGGTTISAAIKSDGTLWSWGLGTNGQLGDNTVVSKSSPVQTVTFATNWSNVNLGATHAASIKTDGTLWCWGLNTSGQLGDSSITHRSSPVQTVAFGTNWSSISCGASHTLATKTDNTLWVWGNNASGQLGDNTAATKSSPVQTIAFGTNWSSISCGASHSASIKTDGTLWCWGLNTNGQLGDNTAATKSSPVQTVTFGTNWSFVACGDNHTAAIKNDNSLWVWGNNASGQLGQNDIVHRSSPIQTVAFGTNWSQISAGTSFTTAKKTNGSIWSFGLGTSGQLGDGTLVSKSSPVQMAGSYITGVADPYFKYNTLLLTGDGVNNGQNNTFVDGSSNQFAITRNGNTTQGSFSPFGYNWSNYFDGTGDYLSSSNNLTQTGNFTIEGWINTPSRSTNVGIFTIGPEASGRIIFYINSSNQLLYDVYFVGSTNLGGTVPTNSWVHIAFVRSGTTVTAYIDGVATGTTGTLSGTIGNSSAFYIGSSASGSNPLTGYMSNIRVTNSALYAGTFTPSNTPLTTTVSAGSVALLTCQSNRFIDNSSNAFAITPNGDVNVTNFAPFAPLAAYDVSSNGGSGYFDGSGDYLSVGYSSELLLNGTDCTVEGWFYLTATPNSGDTTNLPRAQPLLVQGVGAYQNNGTDHNWMFLLDNSYLYFGKGPDQVTVAASSVPLNSWVHLAGTMTSGGTGKIYINGTEAGSATGRTAFGSSTSYSTRIGYGVFGSGNGKDNFLTGYMSGVYITKGTAKTSFTLTSPPTAASGRPLLLNFTNGSILDSTAKNDLETVGDAQISTSVKKFGTGSMKFDGTGDYLSVPDCANFDLTGDFTIECWINLSSTSNPFPRVFSFGTYNAANNLDCSIDTSTKYLIVWYNGTQYDSGISTINFGTWYHIAIVRSGSTIKAYVDGTSKITISSATASVQRSQPFYVGNLQGFESSTTAAFVGYIDDFRLTKGIARYTANFTPQPIADMGAGGANWNNIDAGDAHVIASKTDGTVYDWGLGTTGQLGNRFATTTIHPVIPLAYSGFGTDWSSVSVGAAYTIAKKTDNTLWSWGTNGAGQLGDNTTLAKLLIVQECSLSTNWNTINAGVDHSVATKTDGTCWAFGNNTNGGIGDNTTTTRSSPVQNVFRGTTWNNVNGGNLFTIATKSNGTIYSWGLGTSGQLGDNTAVSKNYPTIPFSFGVGTTWSSISCGATYSSGLKTDGTLWCWGLGAFAQLGNNTTANQSIPTQEITYSTTWSKVSAGYSHTGAIKTDGTAWTWGLGTSGQLGDATIVSKSSPVQVTVYTENWSSVACGSFFTAAIKTDGTLWTWGYNTYGRLGDNTITHRSSPIQTVAGGTNWSSVACGFYHTAAIKTDGTLWTWGLNNDGQLGDNTIIHRSSPVQVFGFATNWSSVACGYTHTSAIKTDGTLWTWGKNAYGQLGDNTKIHRSSPIQTITGGTNWSSVACGFYHTTAIKTDVTLWTWGRNSYGSLGDNTIIDKSSPVQTITGGSNWSSVACGWLQTAATKKDGTLWTWGRNSYGQLGDNTITHRSSPIQTITGGSNWSSVGSGMDYTAAIKTDGTIWTWGLNSYGRLGDNTFTNRSSPIQTFAFGINWSSIACGDRHTAAIKTDGTLWTWGGNSNGQLGDNTNANKTFPVQPIAYSFATNWSNISCGAINTVATKTNGTLWMWGAGTNGSLGNNLTTTTSLPIQTLAYGTNWSQTNFSAPSKNSGSSTTAAIKTDGTLWVWGNNNNGQLANTLFPITRSSPNQTLDYSNQWQQVTGGSTHTMAIKQDGTLWGFGLNSEGEIGANNTSFMVSPIQEVTGSSWKQVAAGFRFSAAIKANNTLWIWGRNSYGNLGDNTTVSKSSPIQEVTGGSWNQIACGSYHMGGIKTDGTLWMWGLNTSGQLGDSTTIHRSSPIQTVAGGTNWKQVACGSGAVASSGHTAAIKTDGTLWVWGNGNNGRLGDNTATSKSSPIQTITGGTNWRQVVCTAATTLATKTDGSLWSWGLSGVIGDNTAVSKSSPVQTAIGDKSWKNITIGNMGLATYAIRDWSY